MSASTPSRRPIQIAAVVAAVYDRFGGIDVLVNNAGYGYLAAIEEGDGADVRALFEKARRRRNLTILTDALATRVWACVMIGEKGAHHVMTGAPR